MSAVADILARLIEAGTPPDVAALAVTEAFAAGAACGKSGGIPVDESAERRRAYDRERKRLAAEIRRNSTENPQNSNSALPSSSSQQTQVPKEGKKRERGTTLSAEWMPLPSHFDEGTALGLRDDDVRGMAADMRLWAGANSNRAVARKSNWDMTFSAWMRREAGKRKPTNGKPGIIDAADRALENIIRASEAADGGAGVGGQETFRLVSQR